MRRFVLALIVLPALGCFAEPSEIGSAAPDANTGMDTDSLDGGTTASTLSGSAGGTSTTGDGETGTSDPFDSSSSWFGTTWGESSSSDNDTGSSTAVFSECGDGIVEGAERCDDEVLALEPGACRPDCSGPIPTRRIVISSSASQGDLGPDPIATVDGMCAAGSKAMFADGVGRRATLAPNASVDPIDWVLEPFTAYVNAGDELVWVTDDVPLLGVRRGVSASLVAPILPLSGNPPGVLTGMTHAWTSPPQADCNGWTAATSAHDHSSGIPWLVELGGFLDNGALSGCDLFDRVYCVEQSGE